MWYHDTCVVSRRHLRGDTHLRGEGYLRGITIPAWCRSVTCVVTACDSHLRGGTHLRGEGYLRGIEVSPAW